MEKKTIGSFLSALRKTHGMTQKQLAEKLNVSDKAVSRWERDECAPDLTVIPVLAEIFGVTSDEILRGERKTEDKSAEKTDKKNEKQLEYILNNLRTKFLIKSLISIALAVVGLIVAYIMSIVLFDMDTNSYEASQIGFFVGVVFYVVAIVLETIFVISTFSSLKNNDFDDGMLLDIKRKLTRCAKWSFYIILIIFIVSFALWLKLPPYSEIFVLILVGVFALTVVDFFVQKILFKKGVLKANEKQNKRESLRIKTIIITLLVLFITSSVNILANGWFDFRNLTKGTQYTDFKEFKKFIETPIDENSREVVPTEDGNYSYEEGLYFEEDFETVKVQIDENTVKKVVQRNMSIYDWVLKGDYELADSVDYALPVTIWTNNDYKTANVILEIMNIGFICLYIIEIISAVFIYFKKNRMLNEKQ